MIFMVGSRKIR